MAGPWEKYQAESGPWAQYGRRSTDAPQVSAPVAQPAPEPSFFDSVKQGAGNLAAGAVRGAGSIGATILYPVDKITDMVKGDRGPTLSSLVTGDKPLSRNEERRLQMDEALRSLGVETDSLLYKGGKLAGEIAGTAGAGGVVANGLTKAAPLIARVAPRVADAVTKFAPVVQSGGMSLGNAATGNALANTAIRAGGGAVSGAATAGLVNPEDAGTGAVIGAVAAPVIQAAGKVGQAIGKRYADKHAEELAAFNRSAPQRQTLAQSVDAGYVVPPNMVKPSTKNALIESFSGKQATSQVASVKNQSVTDRLVRKALGLADDVPLTKGTLEQIRKASGQAYSDVAKLSPKAEIDLEALKQARNSSQGWFNAYNRSASPADLAKAKEFRDLAEVLEMQLESHAKAAGQDAMIPALREARKQIAKTYTVERALNDATGTVNAKVLGRLFDKGKPLSDGLDVAGRFASAFPSVAQAPQQMGSPAAHNLRAMASLFMGGTGAALGGPVGLVAGAAPFVTGPASRAIMFRQGAQKALANQAAPVMAKPAQLAAILQSPEVQQMVARTAPVIAIPGR